MKILALDTATEACSVALGIDERVLERYVELDRGHAERLLPMVDELLAEGGIALASLDAIAFGRGPGAFTGVRLAASVAQGLAFGAGVGVVAVSDLAAVAQQAAELQPEARRVLVVNDARMREVYWAEFTVDRLVSLQGTEQVSAAASVTVPDDGGGRWVAAGRGLAAYPELAERCRTHGARVQARPPAAGARGPDAGPPGCRGGPGAASGARIARLCQGSGGRSRNVMKLQ